MEVTAKWKGIISQASPETLHSETFLQRVSRSADYFANALETLFTRPLQLTAQVETGNKQVAQRLATILPEQQQTWKAKMLLLRHISKEGFSITCYLKQKQMTLLDAMESDSKKVTKMGFHKKKTKPQKTPKLKSEEITKQLFRQGKSIDEIAAERRLSSNTVFKHLLKFVQTGEIKAEELYS